VSSNGHVHLDKFSIGMGDRFARQGHAQLQACLEAAARGASVVPVWNKSWREHRITGSDPASVRIEADEAVHDLDWPRNWFVDADHINLSTVEHFVASSDFFTVDVADYISRSPGNGSVDAFLARHSELVGRIEIPGIDEPFGMDRTTAAAAAAKYLFAVAEAGRIYRRIASEKGEGRFVTEVSMDETDSPQTPPELLLILAAIADEGIPIQTVAPRFPGRFNKGVDYAGNVGQFEREFGAHLAVIAYARLAYGLPGNLKLSVHSGSDKFSIYEPMRRALRRFDAGIHLKTAGTTWLEELIGLAEAGGEGLAMAKDIYASAWQRRDELCSPYLQVIDIDPARLPSPDEVRAWSGEEYVAALRHDPRNPAFNPHLRQLLHVGYKVAAEYGERYLELLEACRESISRNVTGNLYRRHMEPLFVRA
jgi:tagaturonate epimerase